MSRFSNGARSRVPRSGKAGGGVPGEGLVRRNPSDATSPAAALTFTLSSREELGGDWGYRRLTTYGGMVGRPSTRAHAVHCVVGFSLTLKNQRQAWIRRHDSPGAPCCVHRTA